MIRCNLAILLAERNLKITQVSKDTGISRTTLTSLSNNYSQGIQFDTINTLCNYLKISTEQLIPYMPVDIKILDITLNDSKVTITLTVIEQYKSYNISINAYISEYLDNTQKISAFDLFLNTDEIIPVEYIDPIKNIVKSIPISFMNDIKNNILEKLILNFDNDRLSKDIQFHLYWKGLSST